MGIKKPNVVIISASSDVGEAMCIRWISKKWNIVGTYRTDSNAVDNLMKKGVRLMHCDLEDRESIHHACSKIVNAIQQWDVLVLCPGKQEPVGPFLQCDFIEWENSVKSNFTRQLEIVHRLLPYRNMKSKLGPIVLFFAGGGTNNATVNYSAYTISKIALIKMCELLDAEIPDTRFSIVGPGWVKTKIHKATLNAKELAGDNYEKTKCKLSSDECTPMNEVLDCCDWIIDSPHEIVSGRNFSVVFDSWGTEILSKALLEEYDMYKLRRYGNDKILKNGKSYEKK
ncbi:MAG: SDR family oxidoreductase [Thermodesulfobacteriota bacterium]|nr:SDR family oxidoreductase [Thermodesulfobacteriota bacterium]